MGFEKKTWKDRISQYPNRRTINDGIVTKTVTVGRDEGEVTQEGDAFSASNMNDLEVRIESAFASGGGGGGGGGHTIIDNEGVALTQRTGLQFKGAYSEDNSTDGITEVNVIRNMKKAEFDLLTDDEKKGIINVTDITSGTGDKFQPIIYSEEEREIGVWTDGKPLYEKTFKVDNISIDTSHATEIADLTTLNVETWVGVVNSVGYLHAYDITVNENRLSIGYKPTSKKLVSSQSYTQQYTTVDIITTIRYTKTIDTPGSGKWTPQGVPAVHYSTEEQVVGTWIDGSTIYEKGLTVSGSLGDTFNYIPHGVSNFNQLLDYFGYCTYGSSDKMNIPSLRGSSYVTISSWDATNIRLERANLSSAISDINLVIRYTKSST